VEITPRWCRKGATVKATERDIQYDLDGVWAGQYGAAGFVGTSMWPIIDLQLEGSSGSLGPDGDTHDRARNADVGRNRAW
jgi:galactan endo-beta-1,3-galactanase